MKKLKYIKGDATIPQDSDGVITVICHCCNAFGGWGRGFVLSLGKTYPKAKNDYVDFCQPYQHSNEKRNELMGKVCLSKTNDKVYIANIIGQYYYSRNQNDFRNQAGVNPNYLPSKSDRFVNYDSIRRGIRQLVSLMDGLNFIVQMPKIGCGLAGGNWKIIEKIIVEELSVNDIQIYVYEL